MRTDNSKVQDVFEAELDTQVRRFERDGYAVHHINCGNLETLLHGLDAAFEWTKRFGYSPSELNLDALLDVAASAPEDLSKNLLLVLHNLRLQERSRHVQTNQFLLTLHDAMKEIRNDRFKLAALRIQQNPLKPKSVEQPAPLSTQATIETKRLLLRPCRMEDADALTNLMTPEISKWVAVWPTPLLKQDTQGILRNTIEAMQQDAVFAAVVMCKDSGNIIGWCKLDIADNCAELGYWIGTAFQRKGFAMELSQGAISFAFDQLGMTSVRAGAQVDNTASLALLAKLGMTQDCVEAVWAPARQRFEDCAFWHVSRDDWPRLQ